MWTRRCYAKVSRLHALHLSIALQCGGGGRAQKAGFRHHFLLVNQLSAERLFLLALTVLCAISQLCAIEKDKQLTPPIFLLLLLLTLLLTHLVVIVLTVVIFLVLLVLLLLLVVVVVVVRWGQKTNQPTDKAFLRVE